MSVSGSHHHLMPASAAEGTLQNDSTNTDTNQSHTNNGHSMHRAQKQHLSLDTLEATSYAVHTWLQDQALHHAHTHDQDLDHSQTYTHTPPTQPSHNAATAFEAKCRQGAFAAATRLNTQLRARKTPNSAPADPSSLAGPSWLAQPSSSLEPSSDVDSEMTESTDLESLIDEYGAREARETRETRGTRESRRPRQPRQVAVLRLVRISSPGGSSG